jgi:hypothetical protein
MKFKRLPPRFRDRGTQWRYQEGLMSKLELRNSRWQLPTGCTCISAPIQDGQEISTAKPSYIFDDARVKGVNLIVAYCEHVLRRTTPKFKTADSQAGSTYRFLRPKDTKKIRKRTFKQLRKNFNQAKLYLQCCY